MPTHRDMPWEQDARAERQHRPAPRAAPVATATRRTHPALLVLLVVAGVVAVTWFAAGRMPAAAPTPAVVPLQAAPAKVTALRSRWSPSGALEVWGTSDAANGRTVTVRTADGSQTWAVPVSGGAFFLSTPMPRRDGLQLQAAVTG